MQKSVPVLFFSGVEDREAFLKAYIHGHYRTTKDGKKVWVESYSDKRQGHAKMEFAHWNHRLEHVKQHLAHGDHKTALQAHDLDHGDAQRLAVDLNLHDDQVKHASKKELMQAIHDRMQWHADAYQAKVKDQQAKRPEPDPKAKPKTVKPKKSKAGAQSDLRALVKEAIAHLQVDLKQGDIPADEKDEDRVLVATLKAGLAAAKRHPPPDPADQVIEVAGQDVPFAYRLIDAKDLALTEGHAENQYRDRTRAASDEQVANIAAEPQIPPAGRLAADGLRVAGAGQRRTDHHRRQWPHAGHSSRLQPGTGQSVQGRSGASGRALRVRRQGRCRADGRADPGARAPERRRCPAGRDCLKRRRQAAHVGPGASARRRRAPGRSGGLPAPTTMAGSTPPPTGSSSGASSPRSRSLSAPRSRLAMAGCHRRASAACAMPCSIAPMATAMSCRVQPRAPIPVSAMCRRRLIKLAPTAAQVKGDAQAGRLHDLDISADIVAATATLAKVRADKTFGSVDEYLSQSSLFGDPLSEEAKTILRHFDVNLRSAKAMGEFLRDYYDAVRALGDPNRGSLFGDAPAPDQDGGDARCSRARAGGGRRSVRDGGGTNERLWGVRQD
ncbi:MAG: hypothetical protein MZV65_32020 [Chromatiales bacterium]|nr:hypothetical protein [Chromatiales bacterium]